MENNKQKIPELLLEKFLRGELSEKKAAEISERLLKYKKERQRIEEIRKSNEQILKKYQPGDTVPLIKQRLAAENIRQGSPQKGSLFDLKKIMMRLIPAMGILVILFIVFLPKLLMHQHPADPLIDKQNGIRVKGRPQLFIFRQNRSKEEKLKDRDHVNRGDLLQVAYLSGDQKYGVIFSLDGRGTIILHYPYNKSGSAQLKQGKRIPLKEAYELDDAPKYEIFFFISSKKKIRTEDVLKQAELLAKDPDKAVKLAKQVFKQYQLNTLVLLKGAEL